MLDLDLDGYQVADSYIFYPVARDMTASEVGKRFVFMIKRIAEESEIRIIYHQKGNRVRISGSLRSLGLVLALRGMFLPIVPHVTYIVGPN